MKIKKDDKVIVIAGKSLGVQGKVIKTLPQENRVIVEGVNLAKIRQRPRQQGKKGQVAELPRPIDVSNIALFCSACSKGVRAGYQIKGKNKARVCRSCQKTI